MHAGSLPHHGMLCGLTASYLHTWSKCNTGKDTSTNQQDWKSTLIACKDLKDKEKCLPHKPYSKRRYFPNKFTIYQRLTTAPKNVHKLFYLGKWSPSTWYTITKHGQLQSKRSNLQWCLAKPPCNTSQTLSDVYCQLLFIHWMFTPPPSLHVLRWNRWCLGHLDPALVSQNPVPASKHRQHCPSFLRVYTQT